MGDRLHDDLRPLETVLNPLRSEGEAFRFLLYVVATAAAVVAVVLLVRLVS